jgi:hypothetical protein
MNDYFSRNLHTNLLISQIKGCFLGDAIFAQWIDLPTLTDHTFSLEPDQILAYP